MEALKTDTTIVVDNGQQDKFNAKIIRLMRWNMPEYVYLVRIMRGEFLGSITHVKHSWIVEFEEPEE